MLFQIKPYFHRDLHIITYKATGCKTEVLLTQLNLFQENQVASFLSLQTRRKHWRLAPALATRLFGGYPAFC